MGWNIKQNGDGTVTLTDNYSTLPVDGVVIGRGTTDTDITYIALRNSAGTLCYIYPATAGNAIVVQTTVP